MIDATDLDQIRAAVREVFQDEVRAGIEAIAFQPCMTIHDAAEYLHESPRTITRRIARREFDSSVVWNNGKEWRFNPEPLRKWRETQGILGKRRSGKAA